MNMYPLMNLYGKFVLFDIIQEPDVLNNVSAVMRCHVYIIMDFDDIEKGIGIVESYGLSAFSALLSYGDNPHLVDALFFFLWIEPDKKFQSFSDVVSFVSRIIKTIATNG